MTSKHHGRRSATPQQPSPAVIRQYVAVLEELPVRARQNRASRAVSRAWYSAVGAIVYRPSGSRKGYSVGQRPRNGRYHGGVGPFGTAYEAAMAIWHLEAAGARGLPTRGRRSVLGVVGTAATAVAAAIPAGAGFGYGSEVGRKFGAKHAVAVEEALGRGWKRVKGAAAKRGRRAKAPTVEVLKVYATGVEGHPDPWSDAPRPLRLVKARSLLSWGHVGPFYAVDVETDGEWRGQGYARLADARRVFAEAAASNYYTATTPPSLRGRAVKKPHGRRCDCGGPCCGGVSPQVIGGGW